MYKAFEFIYKPLILRLDIPYVVHLPEDSTPVRFWTITTPMMAWNGEVIEASPRRAKAVIWHNNKLTPVEGIVTTPLLVGMPCVVMEHLNIDGYLEYMIGRINIMDDTKNFVNFGIPGGTHIRIDMYTGDSRIINA
jgi:hypothetical protein